MEPPVAFGGQYHFVAPVRLRRASSASRADLDALDLRSPLERGGPLAVGRVELREIETFASLTRWIRGEC